MNPSFQFEADGLRDLHFLWEDGEHVFYRGWRTDGAGGRSAVLAVLHAAERPLPAALDRLGHEYELRDELDAAWAARPLALTRQGGRMALLLEDPGGEPLERLVDGPMETDRFLRLAIGIAAALGKAHQRGLVHKDVKPANILVNCADGRARLTGFGIASRLPRERQAPEPPEVIAGTLAYMAPEQTGRMNRSIDSRSDLYALGVTFYQMLIGSLPFSRVRSDGVGALPHRAKARGAFGAVGEHPGRPLRDRHEAPRQDGRGALPDRRWRRARSAALSSRMGAARGASSPLHWAKTIGPIGS